MLKLDARQNTEARKDNMQFLVPPTREENLALGDNKCSLRRQGTVVFVTCKHPSAQSAPYC